MTQVSIIRGIYGTDTSSLLDSLPLNLRPIIEDNGISKGMLESYPGVKPYIDLPAHGRGGVLTQFGHLRVIGATLYRVSAVGLEALGSITDDGQPCAYAQSFDRVAIASGNSLWLYNASGLVRVTDPDLGVVKDVIWIDGYFMTTDGTSLVVTELTDPTAVDPLKYGSAEADPDPVIGLIEVRGQVYALNRYTIECFFNTGKTGFPFQRQRGAQINRGCVGVRAKCLFADTFAFVGGGRNERPRVYLAGNGEALPISTRVIDEALAKLSEAELATIELESREGAGFGDLLVHLPGATYVYGLDASSRAETPVWFRLASGVVGEAAYRPRRAVLVDGEWICDDLSGSRLGRFDAATAAHWGDLTGFQFDTPLIFNEGSGAILHNVELVTMAGRASVPDEPVILMSMTRDGRTWGTERAVSLGAFGERDQRPAWRRNGKFDNWCGLRFRGAPANPSAFLRLDVQFEALG